MIDREDARRRVEEELSKLRFYPSRDPEDPLIILDDSTIEFDHGYVFVYTSKKYYETREFKYALAANAPFIVDKRDGTLHLTGTARSIEFYIDEFKKSRP